MIILIKIPSSIQQNNKIKVFQSNKELWWVGSINYGIEILFNEFDLKDKDVVIFANNDVQIDKSYEFLYNELKKDFFRYYIQGLIIKMELKFQVVQKYFPYFHTLQGIQKN